MIAFLAHYYDTPIFYFSSSSAKNSMPFFISAYLIQNVFKKLAVPPATEAIMALIRISLGELEGILAVNFPKIFLKIKAVETEDPTAAVYPNNRS